MKKKIHIDGMYCHACEVVIERKLKRVEGVHSVHVHRKQKSAQIECEDDVGVSELQKVLPEKYRLSEKEFKHENRGKVFDIGVSLIIILGLYLLFSHFDLLPKNFNLSENVSYGFILVIGLIASTSTCLAVAGGVLIAIAAKHNEQHPELTGIQKFRPHIYFNIGRIIGYGIFGGLIGLLGSIVTLSNFANGIITILASILMIVIGLQLLHLFPFLDRISIKPPKFIAHKVHDASEDEKSTYSNRGSFVFGALTFFLPCGFTQALQLYVLAQGDPVVGALTMLVFSIGTLPTLASIGAIMSFVSGKVQKHFMTFAGILVIVLGLFTLQPGLTLVGVQPPSLMELLHGSASESNAEAVVVEIIDGKQIVNMKVEGLDYYPHQFIVKQGIPVEWVIEGQGAEGCGQVLTAPKLDVTEYLKTDAPTIIEFTPEEIGEIQFSCSMGMTTPGAAFTVVA